MATILSNMCVTYAMLGQMEQAESAGSQSLAIVPGGKGFPSAMVNLATVYGMPGDHAEAIRLLDQGLAMHEEIGDRMRACEALIARSEINRLRGDLAGAAADTERAVAEAQVWGYRYVAAAAQRQQARILAAMGRSGEAELARARADEAYARLDGVSRDPLTELVLANDESRHHQRRSNPASLMPRR